MTKTVDYYLSLESPRTYLGHARLLEIARRRGARIVHKPVDLSVIFPATGGLPLAKRAPARQAYRLVELERWRTHLNLPLNLHPAHFPVPERQAALLVIAAELAGHDPGPLAGAILRACWAEDRDISSPETLAAIAAETGLDAKALMDAAEGPEPAARYEAYTKEALEIGVFGVPTYVYADEMFWGQDRLDFLDRALKG